MEEKAAATATKFTPVTVSETGLEVIEPIQFDNTFRADGVWISNPDLEDKAGTKERVKGTYKLPTDKFRIKIRNVAGDEVSQDMTLHFTLKSLWMVSKNYKSFIIKGRMVVSNQSHSTIHHNIASCWHLPLRFSSSGR